MFRAETLGTKQDIRNHSEAPTSGASTICRRNSKMKERNMVEAFVNKLTLYNDGRAEIEFNFRDELEEVLLWAAMRKKEVNKYAG